MTRRIGNTPPNRAQNGEVLASKYSTEVAIPRRARRSGDMVPISISLGVTRRFVGGYLMQVRERGGGELLTGYLPLGLLKCYKNLRNYIFCKKFSPTPQAVGLCATATYARSSHAKSIAFSCQKHRHLNERPHPAALLRRVASRRVASSRVGKPTGNRRHYEYTGIKKLVALFLFASCLFVAYSKAYRRYFGRGSAKWEWIVSIWPESIRTLDSALFSCSPRIRY